MIPVLCVLLCLTLEVSPRQVSRVVDGDTFDLFTVGVTTTERVRVLGVDAAELREPLGPAARDSTIAWLARGSFTISTCRRDSFGRLLTVVTRGTDTLAVRLVAAGVGVPYHD